MRARLIVTTIVMGARARRGRDRARGQAGAAGHVEVPGPPDGGTGSPQPREPAAERVPALLERDREHGRGPWAMRPENELGSTPTTTRSRRSAPSTAQYLCGTQPKPNDPCYTIVSEQAVVDLRVPPDAQPLAHGRRRPLRGPQGKPDGHRGRRELDQGRLLPHRPLQPQRQRADDAEGVLGLLHELPGRLRPAGSTSTTRRRTASRSI